MSNIAIVFAGGTGTRMNTKSKPKQFLELHNKPILIYTLEAFESHPEIDAVILVIIAQWKDYCKSLINKYGLNKICSIVTGGNTALDSQRNGLIEASRLFPDDSIVLIHDGVRPLVDQETISKNIEAVKKYGNAITVVPAIETIIINDESGTVGKIVDRSAVSMAKAPQSFYLRDLLNAHRQADAEGMTFIDSASLMQYYGYQLHPVQGSPDNIKITTPNDFYTFRALVDARENSQIFGL